MVCSGDPLNENTQELRPAKRRNVESGAISDKRSVAAASFVKGAVVFKEHPSLAVLSRPGTEEVSQPVFCNHCFAPAGPMEVHLALASNRVGRQELFEFVSSNGGFADGHSLQRWADFAAKTGRLPRVAGTPPDTTGLFVSHSEISSFFCSQVCRDSWLRGEGRAFTTALSAWQAVCKHAARTDHDLVLRAAASLLLRASLRQGAWSPKDVTGALCQTLLCDCRRLDQKDDLLPRKVGVRAHALVVAAIVACLDSDGASSLKDHVGCAVTRRLHAAVVGLLDRGAWALDGATLPSALGLYCDAMCSKADEKAQTTFVRALGPVVASLCEQQAAATSDEERESADGDDAEDTERLHVALPSPEVAQKTQPILLSGLFTEEEVSLVKRLSQDLAEDHKHDSSQWRTRYLHAGGAFKARAPGILAKLTQAAVAADAKPGGFGLLGESASRLRPRVIEHHLVSSGGSLPDPTHFDGGSVLTIDTMLSVPGRDFDGGEFCTTEDGVQKQHVFGFGDALVFISHKCHHVRPVRQGLRETLILELWEGEERECDHRCPKRWGNCSFQLESSGSATVDEDDSLVLQRISRDATAAFAPSAFDGLAFFPRVAEMMSQSEGRGDTPISPNVQVVFEDATPVATVRALRDIVEGEPLILAQAGESDDEEEEESGEREVECSAHAGS